MLLCYDSTAIYWPSSRTHHFDAQSRSLNWLSKTHMPIITVVFVCESEELGKGAAHKHFIQPCSCLNIFKCSMQNIV